MAATNDCAATTLRILDGLGESLNRGLIDERSKEYVLSSGITNNEFLHTRREHCYEL
jgi:hypothetical protein